MPYEKGVRDFVIEWFGKFDQLAPAEDFIPYLDPMVDWDMPDADPSLFGHEKFRAWYASILDSFVPPCIHDISDVQISHNTLCFAARFRGNLKVGGQIDARVRETWKYTLRPDGTPNITHYKVTLSTQDAK